MRLQRSITQFIALSLAVLTLGATAPVSAAEIAAPANIGSVSAVGSVQLRGVGISEGTLFSGDRLNVAPGGYAKVVLGAGPKVEVGGSSDVTVSRDADAINIQMTSGNIAFSGNGQKPVRVRVGVYEITAAGQSRGSVAFVGSSALSVRVLDGTVSVRNTLTKQSSTVGKGSDKLISLSDSGKTGVLLASTAPTSIPAAPTMPAPAGMSHGMKTALIVGSVLGSAAAIAVLMTKNDDTDTEAALRLQRTTLSTTLSNATATSQQAAAAATQIASTTAATNSAIAASTVPAATKTALQAQATTLTAKAQASQVQIANLQLQLQSLQTQLSNASGATVSAIQSQINTVVGSLNSEVSNLNSEIAQLNALVQSAVAAGVPNVPSVTVQPIPPAVTASASIP